eukprot:scaffold233465_cov23-Tisochrysis_lutea.AAC.1
MSKQCSKHSSTAATPASATLLSGGACRCRGPPEGCSHAALQDLDEGMGEVRDTMVLPLARLKGNVSSLLSCTSLGSCKCGSAARPVQVSFHQ